MSLQPSEAALWALIAVCLVMVGAILTTGVLGVAERGTILAGIVAVLFAVGWRIRRQRGE
jgi:hypothetical protein